MQALLDGDIIIFRGAFAAEKTLYGINLHGKVVQFDSKKEAMGFIDEHGLNENYELERERVVEPLENALHNVKVTMDLIKERTKDDCPIVFLSGSKNFRKFLCREYKANRDKTMRPHWEQECITYLKDNFVSSQTDWIEADDGIGIAMDNNTICVSIDKDLDQLEGKHYNWVKDVSYTVDDFQATYNFCFQMIKGDSTDNVRGIPGWGDKAAGQALALATTPETLLWACQDAYKEVFKDSWKNEWELNHRLLGMLRTEEDLKWAERIVNRQAASN